MKLILMRGVPGSGKSTLAKQLLAEHMKTPGSTGVILSTDMQFMVDGKYQFDITKLGWAHNRNRLLCENHMEQKTGLIIIDNTNLSHSERDPYIRMAKYNGYEIELVDSKAPWAKDAEQCAAKNTHGVPLLTIKRMLQKLSIDNDDL